MEYFASIVSPLSFLLFVAGIFVLVASIMMLSEVCVSRKEYDRVSLNHGYLAFSIGAILIFTSILLPPKEYLEKQIKLKSCEKGGE